MQSVRLWPLPVKDWLKAAQPGVMMEVWRVGRL